MKITFAFKNDIKVIDVSVEVSSGFYGGRVVKSSCEINDHTFIGVGDKLGDSVDNMIRDIECNSFLFER